jgi:RHH-type rel operon transcriptional repressor/antitoxin RelB
MLTVRLPDNLEKRLNALAMATKRSKSYYVREALERVMEDMRMLIWPKQHTKNSSKAAKHPNP